ncbi:molybdenum cofactor guanylyltransferase [Microbacterium sp. 22242]|uniref:molybdenum cofactor guanylyltransferase n=1 Tax=Microbacterium sp. 22242 TaxID=3453896 RepID=UPI003F83C2D8
MTVPGATGVAGVMLVGGRARRMDGAAKPLLLLGGRSLLARGRTALADAGVSPIVAVGPRAEEPGLVWVREDPPFGGPVAAIAAALARDELAQAGRILLLAGDLIHPDAVVRRLLAASAEGADSVAFDADGRPQWLAGIYRTTRVRAALAALGSPAGASCRALLGGLAIRWIPDQDGITADVDSPADLDRARADLEEHS